MADVKWVRSHAGWHEVPLSAIAGTKVGGHAYRAVTGSVEGLGWIWHAWVSGATASYAVDGKRRADTLREAKAEVERQIRLLLAMEGVKDNG